MNTTELFSFSSYIGSLVASFMLLSATILGGNLKERVFRRFFLLVLLQTFTIFGDISIFYILKSPANNVSTLIYIVDYAVYVFQGLQLIILGLYLHAYLPFKTRFNLNILSFIVFCGISDILLSTFAYVNKLYAYIDEFNIYHKGDLFWLSHLFPTIAILAVAILAIQYKKILNTREWITLLLYPITPFICYIIEIIYPDLWISYIGSSLTLFLIYINNQIGLKLKLKEQENELIQSQISIMFSQIQPHFLYNTLTAIDELCYNNPTAHKAVITFAEYLRTNMDSLTKKTVIPFEKELEHTRKYLWLEKLRFEERLNIVYDIKVDEFMLPPLTLQPIVENSVKYGITKKRTGGTITIKTDETDSEFLISISDDGIGFDPNIPLDDGRSHIGITNVRTRLTTMCNGQLIISSEPNIGTTAIIKIPKGGI